MCIDPAGAAALQFAWHQLQLARVISLIRHGNDTSCRVAERLGGKCIDDAQFLVAPAHVYAYYAPAH